MTADVEAAHIVEAYAMVQVRRTWHRYCFWVGLALGYWTALVISFTLAAATRNAWFLVLGVLGLVKMVLAGVLANRAGDRWHEACEWQSRG